MKLSDVSVPSTFSPSPSSSSHPPLFSLRSHRLRIGFLLMFVYYAGSANRMSISTAVVCMVNRTVLSRTHPDNVTGEPVCGGGSEVGDDDLAIEGHLLWTPSEQSLAVSSSFYGSFITVLISGACADYFGPGPVLIATLVTSTILTLAVPLLVDTSYLAFIASRMVIGITESFLTPTLNCTAARWFPAMEKTTIAAVYTCGLQLAAGFASLLAGQLCKSSLLGGWPSIFYVCGCISTFILVLWLVFGSSDPQSSRWATQDERDYIEETVHVPRKKISMAKSPWSALICSAPLHSILSCSFAFGFSTSTMQSFLPSYLKEQLGLPVDLIGVYTMAPFLCQMIMKCVCGPLTDYVAVRGIVTLTTATKIAQCIGSFGASIALVSFAFIPTCNNPQWALPLLMIYGSVYAGGLCGFYTSLLTIAPKYTGTITSLSMVFTMLASICSSILVTTLTSLGASYKWHIVFVCAAVFQAIGGVHYLISGSTESQAWSN